jgi:hypothetical protein
VSTGTINSALNRREQKQSDRIFQPCENWWE